MKKIFNFKSITLFALFATLVFASCKKHTNSENLKVADVQAHFANVSGSKLFAISPSDSVWIKVGITSTANYSRTVTIKPTSKSAVEGTHYTVSKKLMTFAPGQVLDSFYVKPTDVSRYLAGLKDTIDFSIIEPSITPSSYNSNYKLIVRGPCFASDIKNEEFDGLVGAYPLSLDDPFGSPYGPYLMTLVAHTSTSLTTEKIVVNNLWDDSWGDVPFNVDFSDPTFITVTPVTTITAGNAGNVFGATYNGMKIIVRAHSNGNVGTMDFCQNTFTLEYQIGIYNPATGATVGFSGTQFTSIMKR